MDSQQIKAQKKFKIKRQRYKRWLESEDGKYCLKDLKEEFGYEGPAYDVFGNETFDKLSYKEGSKRTIQYMTTFLEDYEYEDNTQD